MMAVMMREDILRDDGTDSAFRDPRPGDEFSEMYSWWMFVLSVEPDGGPVVVAEQDPQARGGVGRERLRFPDDARLREFACVHEFRRAYAYGTIPGYTVRLERRGTDVSGWLDFLRALSAGREMAGS